MISNQDDDERQPLLNGAKLNGDGCVGSNLERGTVDDNEPSTWDCLKIMTGIWLTTFLAALDGTIVATLSTAISDSFDSLALLSWVQSGYLIACAAFQPVSGKLTDIYGRRAGFMLAIVFFSAGNIICALAQKDWVMIVGRLVAGAGGGCEYIPVANVYVKLINTNPGLNTISTFVASDMIPLRRRGLWQGISNLNYGVCVSSLASGKANDEQIGLAIGGVIGGWINDFAGWRWAFGFQIPLTILCAIQVWFTVKIPVKKSEGSKLRRVDFLGCFTLVTALVLLLLALNSGGNIVPWISPLVLVSLSLSAVFLIGFFYVETRIASEPIIPMSQLTVRTVLAACFTNWFGAMAFTGLLFYVPIYFQIRGDSTSTAGAKLSPLSIGIGVGSFTAGLIMRATGRYWWLNVIMMTLLAAAFAAQTILELNTTIWPVLIGIFVIGFGYSSLLTVTLTAFVAAVEHQYQAVITSASYAFRSTGSTIGLAICSAVFQNVLNQELWDRLGDRPEADELIPKIRARLEFVRTMDPYWKEPVLDIYMDAMRGVFVALLTFAILSALVSLPMKEHKLHTNLARRE